MDRALTSLTSHTPEILAIFFILGFVAGGTGHYYRVFMASKKFSFRSDFHGAVIKAMMGGLVGVVVDTNLQYAIMAGLFVDLAYENISRVYMRFIDRDDQPSKSGKP